MTDTIPIKSLSETEIINTLPRLYATNRIAAVLLAAELQHVQVECQLEPNEPYSPWVIGILTAINAGFKVRVTVPLPDAKRQLRQDEMPDQFWWQNMSYNYKPFHPYYHDRNRVEPVDGECDTNWDFSGVDRPLCKWTVDKVNWNPFYKMEKREPLVLTSED